MDKNELYSKAEKAINQALEATKSSVKMLSEKAGEAAHVTKLLIDKATLEHRVSKKFAQLGSRVYEQSVKQGKTVTLEDAEIKEIVEQTKKLDAELSKVEATIAKERQQKKSKKP